MLETRFRSSIHQWSLSISKLHRRGKRSFTQRLLQVPTALQLFESAAKKINHLLTQRVKRKLSNIEVEDPFGYKAAKAESKGQAIMDSSD